MPTKAELHAEIAYMREMQKRAKSELADEIGWMRAELTKVFNTCVQRARMAHHNARSQPEHRPAEGFIDLTRFLWETEAHGYRNCAAGVGRVLQGQWLGYPNFDAMFAAHQAARDAGETYRSGLSSYDDVDELLSGCKSGTCMIDHYRQEA